MLKQDIKYALEQCEKYINTLCYENDTINDIDCSNFEFQNTSFDNCTFFNCDFSKVILNKVLFHMLIFQIQYGKTAIYNIVI